VGKVAFEIHSDRSRYTAGAKLSKPVKGGFSQGKTGKNCVKKRPGFVKKEKPPRAWEAAEVSIL
jgi:hypothetical protein